jgi:flagellar biosynthesis/type III secretory pathway M-ring protein FliF/YscJ
MSGFLSLIPWWAKALVVGVLLTWVVIKADQHGADRIQAKWDKADADRKAAETAEVREGARFGAQAGQNHEDDKRALEAALRRKNGALDEALKKAAQCGPTAADVVLPGALGVHLNDIRPPGPAASEPAD